MESSSTLHENKQERLRGGVKVPTGGMQRCEARELDLSSESRSRVNREPTVKVRMEEDASELAATAVSFVVAVPSTNVQGCTAHDT